MLNATTPLATFVFASIALAERDATRRRGLGLLVGFVGVVLVVQPWDASATGQLPGLVAALAPSISYAVGYVYQRRYLTARGLSPLVVAAGQLVGAALISAPLTALELTGLRGRPGTALVALLALGALGTGAAYVLNFRLIQDEGPTVASTVTYLLPVVAVVLGVAILSEDISLATIVGALISSAA